MSRLYVRVMTGFYTHRKTARLRATIGDDAFWLPPRLWAYAAENQPDGDLSGYAPAELAVLVGYSKDATSMLQALKDCGFIDLDGLIHGWHEHNGYHEKFAKRAKTAAAARWSKEKPPTPPKEEEIDSGKRKVETSIAWSMLVASSKGILGGFYKRPPGDQWDYAEECSLIEVMRRSNFQAELETIQAFQKKPKNFFPQSIARLLSDWVPTLDRARNYEERKQHDNPTKANPRNAGICIPTDEKNGGESLGDFARRKAQADSQRRRMGREVAEALALPPTG